MIYLCNLLQGGELMKRVLIVGAGKGGTALINIIRSTASMKVIAVIDKNKNAEGLTLAKQLHIETGSDWREWMDRNIDIVMEATGEEKVLNEIIEIRNKETVVIPGSVAYIISELMDEKTQLFEQIQQQMDNQELVLNNIRDGMIVIDKQQIVQFVNKSAEDIVGHNREDSIGKNISEVIKNSRLPDVIESREREVNQNTDLNEVKIMLESIIKSSDEAISVVDEKGNGIMINPAYTRVTGLTEQDVIGKPATVDIYEGESMHMKVLQTGNVFRGVHMKVGQLKKDVIVNVAPIIMNGVIRGSVGVLHDVTEIQALTRELKRARQIIRSLEAKYTFDDIIGSSPEMRLALEQAKVGARTPATVLLRGDSGTGKELFAHAIHNESNRKQNKFIRVNCAAIAESFLESELFGYEEGAFSGAKHGGKKGIFEKANHGSIFLDEIGEISLNIQAKLLRVLQEGEIVRAGGTETIHVDVRIITATNINLEKAIMNKTFREDLYYRLNRLPIFIPSLRERISDLAEIANHIIQKLNADYSRTVRTISVDAIAILEQYHWPGNVRELENVLGRAMILMEIHEEVIKKEHLPKLTISFKIKEANILFSEEESLSNAVDRFEKDFIYEVYQDNSCNKTKTAKALNISIRNLYYKFDKYQLE